MKKLFDYECPVHGKFEDWGHGRATKQCPEPNCTRRSLPLPGSKGIKLDGAKLGFPRANRQWDERHQRREEPGREI